MITVTYHADINEVQGDAGLMAMVRADARGPFDRAEWWAGLVQFCGVRPWVVVARDEGAAVILPLAAGAARRGPLSPEGERALCGLANYYSFWVRAVGSDDPALLGAMARDLKRRVAAVGLAPMAGADARALAAAFRRAGWFVDLEASDFNHQLVVGGQSFAQYLAGRPGSLRNTLKRKAGKVVCVVHRGFDAAAWAEYEGIYAASWKPAEGSMDFLRDFSEAEGAAGRLRLGIAYAAIGNFKRAVAAQLWTIEAGTAFIHKLAHVEDAKALSPGTVLSAAMFAGAIDDDRVAQVDFGTGDDPYKRDWMERAEPLYRLRALDPARAANWAKIARIYARRLAGRERAG